MGKTEVKLRFYDGLIKLALGQSVLQYFRNNEEFPSSFKSLNDSLSRPFLYSGEACKRLRLVKPTFAVTSSAKEATHETIIQEFCLCL